MILIHNALLCEAQIFIELFKLIKTSSQPKIYKNDKIILLVSGIGKNNTSLNLEYMFNNFTINRAINIGIAGCNNKNINIGELFSINKTVDNISQLPLITVDKPQLNINTTTTNLYDMEGKYFLDITGNHLNNINIFMFKIVSDHLDDKIKNKDHIKSLFNTKIIKETVKKVIDKEIYKK